MYHWGLGAAPSATVAQALQSASQSSGVPLPILQQLALKESSYNPSAVSSEGARGLMQLMPATGASLGVTNPFDPVQSANAGAQYLESLYKQFGNWNDALIAYNEGPGTLSSGVVLPSSQSYADQILAASGYSASAVPTDSSVAPADGTGDGSGIDLSTVFADSSVSVGGANSGWLLAGAVGLLALVFLATSA